MSKELYLIEAAERIEAAGKGDAWWNGQSKAFQKQYIKDHPTSKYAKNAKSKTDDKPKSKPAKKASVGDAAKRIKKNKPKNNLAQKVADKVKKSPGYDKNERSAGEPTGSGKDDTPAKKKMWAALQKHSEFKKAQDYVLNKLGRDPNNIVSMPYIRQYLDGMTDGTELEKLLDGMKGDGKKKSNKDGEPGDQFPNAPDSKFDKNTKDKGEKPPKSDGVDEHVWNALQQEDHDGYMEAIKGMIASGGKPTKTMMNLYHAIEDGDELKIDQLTKKLQQTGPKEKVDKDPSQGIDGENRGKDLDQQQQKKPEQAEKGNPFASLPLNEQAKSALAEADKLQAAFKAKWGKYAKPGAKRPVSSGRSYQAERLAMETARDQAMEQVLQDASPATVDAVYENDRAQFMVWSQRPKWEVLEKQMSLMSSLRSGGGDPASVGKQLGKVALAGIQPMQQALIRKVAETQGDDAAMRIIGTFMSNGSDSRERKAILVAKQAALGAITGGGDGKRKSVADEMNPGTADVEDGDQTDDEQQPQKKSPFPPKDGDKTSPPKEDAGKDKDKPFPPKDGADKKPADDKEPKPFPPKKTSEKPAEKPFPPKPKAEK